MMEAGLGRLLLLVSPLGFVSFRFVFGGFCCPTGKKEEKE